MNVIIPFIQKWKSGALRSRNLTNTIYILNSRMRSLNLDLPTSGHIHFHYPLVSQVLGAYLFQIFPTPLIAIVLLYPLVFLSFVLFFEIQWIHNLILYPCCVPVRSDVKRELQIMGTFFHKLKALVLGMRCS